MPKVINLRDTGGKVPAGVVRIDRKTKWGNPYRVGRDGTREEVIAKFREWFLACMTGTQTHLPELRGKDLACWCAPEACHGDVLLELANGNQMPGEGG